MKIVASWLRVALMDLRGDLRRFSVLLASLALGVGTIAMVGGAGSALQEGFARDARTMLGADLEAQLSYRAATPEERELFDGFGMVAEIVEVLGRAETDERSALLSLRGADAAYPLLGALSVEETQGVARDLLAERDGAFGMLVTPLALDRLSTFVGGTLTMGEGRFQIRGVLRSLPDQATRGVTFGIPALISLEGLEAANVLDPGSLARYRYKVVFDPGVTYGDAAARVQTAFPDAGWQVNSPEEATAELSRFFSVFSRFLSIVGLTALLVGGVGASNAVSSYITERHRSIATLKSLGATGTRIMVHYLFQVMVMVLLGSAIGLLLGWLITGLALSIIGSFLSISIPSELDWRSLSVAAAFGLLVGFAFAYVPLQRARAVRPASLFRATSMGSEGGLGWRNILRPATLVPVVIAGGLIFGLAVLTTGRLTLVTYYTLGLLVAYAVLGLAALLLRGGLRLLPPVPNTAMRNAVTSIYRPGAPTVTILLSLGLGLSLLVLITMVGHNLSRQLNGEAGAAAPSFIFMDLFDDEVEQLATAFQSDPRVEHFKSTPLLRGNLVAINDVPLSELPPLPAEMSLNPFLEGEIPVSYSAAVPEQSEIVSGQWWAPDHGGDLLVSVADDLREPLGLDLGHEITFQIFGEPVTATVASFREYQWSEGNMNFDFVFSPNIAEEYPASHIGMLKAKRGEEDSVQASLAADLPELTFMRFGDAMAAISGFINALSSTVAAISGLALVSGILVLSGAMAAGRKQRQSDAVVHKVLGATRGKILTGYLIEHSVLGALAALIAVLLGGAGAFFLVTEGLKLDFVLEPLLLVWVVVSAVVLTLAVGAATTWAALSVRPAQFLRGD